MSKIGKRAILLLLALPIGFNVMAQETKKPTLEELIPGGESYRYAENLYGLQWWGDECIKPGVDTLYSIQPKTGKETMVTEIVENHEERSDSMMNNTYLVLGAKRFCPDLFYILLLFRSRGELFLQFT